MKRAVAAIVAALVASAGAAVAKPKKPTLDMRAVPRMAFSPVTMLFTAELRGGEDIEEYYCPDVEWDWDDGGKSVHGSDCPPYSPGTKIERRYTAEHTYRRASVYNVKVAMRRGNRTISVASIRVTVRQGIAVNMP